MSKNKQSNQTLNLAIIHPHAAGLDVGSMKMMVSYCDTQHIQTVKEYNAYTQDLHQLAEDLNLAGELI